MINETNSRRYYRGYSLRPRWGKWEIWWGNLLATTDTLAEAEALVDTWKGDEA